MHLGFKRTCVVVSIFFAPILFWLFLKLFIINFGRLTKAFFIIFIIIQLVWWLFLYKEIKNKQNQRRWNLKRVIFILYRLLVLFSPTILFIILNRLDFFDSSVVWKWIFGIFQIFMIFYQFRKNKNDIGKNDPYRQDEINELREEK
jgi:magnesium-transporting ATPase (P-type)